MSKAEHTITLTDEELYAVWAIITWFDRSVVSGKLKAKLAGMSYSPERPKLEKRFDAKIEDRIIELGERLPHIREEMKKRSQA